MRNPTAHLQTPAGTREGAGVLERTMTGAARRLTSWLRQLAPERQITLGLLEPEEPAHRAHNRARMRARKRRRHMVQTSRRANR